MPFYHCNARGGGGGGGNRVTYIIAMLQYDFGGQNGGPGEAFARSQQWSRCCGYYKDDIPRLNEADVY